MHIKVTVFPDSYEDRVVQITPETYQVYVRASAQNGHANKVVTALLSKHFCTKTKMVSGGMQTHKIFLIG